MEIDARDGRPEDFSPRLLAMAEQPPPEMHRWVLRLLAALVFFIVLWTTFGQLDIVARAEGRLVPQTRLKIVQPLEGGRVARVLVEEGGRVEAGATLLTMDARVSAADLNKLNAELEMAGLQLARVEAELRGDDFRPPREADAGAVAKVREQHRANRRALQAALDEQRAVLRAAESESAAAREVRQKLQEILPIHTANEQAVSRLVQEGHAGSLTLLERQRERIAVERDLRAQDHALESQAARMSEARARIEGIEAARRQKLSDEHVELIARIDRLQEDAEVLRYRQDLMELKAPQAGIVQDLVARTEGTVVPAGTVLMTIVPTGEALQAEVLLEHKDVGFVRAGQAARVKVAAFEFQRYGAVDATVERLSADAVDADRNGAAEGTGSPGYRVLLNLGRQALARDGRLFELRPGMRVSAEIRIGTRTVMEYLLSPVQRALAEAGQER